MVQARFRRLKAAHPGDQWWSIPLARSAISTAEPYPISPIVPNR
jgi:hypothetical protein